MRIQSFSVALLISTLSFLVTGCANAPTVGTGDQTPAYFQGTVHGGQQPVANATIQIYTVGTTFDGSSATPLLSQVVKTDSNGNFSLKSLYSCNNATLVYLLATGGDPGVGAANPNLALMAALGPCSSLGPSTFISVNEVTTVAAVAALAPFMSSGTAIGSSATDQSALVAAFGVASQLANTTTGTSPGTNVSAGFTVPSTLINSLADIVAACINTSGGTASTPTTCGQFFALTTPGNSVPPSNVISALLNLANNPTLNAAALFDLITPSAPFQPTLAVAPLDFRVRPLSQSPVAISVSPQSIVFPAGPVGVPSAAQSVQVQNISAAVVSNLALAFSGANASNFSQTNGCPGTLNPGDICTVQVKLTPSTTGPRIGYLNLTADAVQTQYVALTNVNATPVLSSLSPPTVPAGSPNGLYVYAVGSNFTPASVVQINGVKRPSGYVNSNYLLFLLTSAEQASPGSFIVSVTNPAPGGGTSAAASFIVSPTVGTPVITAVTPSQFVAGAASTTIQVTGPNLSPNCVIQWNGANLATSFGYGQNGYYLQATVSAALLANSGSASVTVTNPTATPSVSNSLAITIAPPPPPTLTGLSTSMVPTNTAVNLTVSGSNFTPTTSVLINGVAVPATFVATYQMSVTLPASEFATPGVYSLVVSNAQGTTSAQNITAYVQILNNSMAYSPLTGLFYLSVPSAAGTPYGNSIVSVDPLTGALGTPIPVGSEPNRMAITSDGRYLWVALDSTVAVRKVDLLTGVAGLQFPIAPGSGGNVVSALAAIPGSTDSVVVSTYYTGYTSPTGTSMKIYDAGVARPKAISFATYAPFPYALIVDSTKNEIYGPGEVDDPSVYNTYTYDATGITLKASTPDSLPQLANLNDDIQIVDGKLYTSIGRVVDAETAAPVGTFYSSGTTPAVGSITVDTALNKAFILEGSNNFASSPTSPATPVTLAVFHADDFSAVPSATLSLSAPNYRPATQFQGPTGARLTRWGANGLAFRGPGGFVSLRTPLVQDLSATVADLSVALSASGSATTGSTTTYTATVTNNGPSSASNVLLSIALPATGSLVSTAVSNGTCSGTSSVLCNLGSLANAGFATVTFNVLQTNSGSAVMTAQVSASETDTVPQNNQASSTSTVTGSPYSLVPAILSLSPAAVLSGSLDTVITVNGSNFTNLSSVLLNGAPLITSFTNSNVLTAVVPAPNLASLGWSSITVSTPAPGGGTSSPLPLTVFSVLNIGANHILTDPYSRNVMASIGAGSASVPANSIATITPDSAVVSSVVPLSAAPTGIALSSDGEVLYALIPGTTSGSIARYNMLTHQTDFTVSGLQATGYNVGLRDLAVQPGSQNTIAVDEGEYPGVALFDADPVAKTLTKRGQDTGVYTGTCLAFRDPSLLLLTDLYSGGGVVWPYQVTPGGLTKVYPASVLNYFSCFKLDGTTLYSQGGGVADVSGTSIVQKGVFPGLQNLGPYGTGIKDFALDSSLGKGFYLTSSTGNYSAVFDGLTTYDTQTFMPTSVLPLPIAAIEGTSSNTGVDAVRWGQDGLAFVTSSGRVYLMRGPAIVPQLLQPASAALPAETTPSSVTHGTGNLTLTITGSNFLPGVAVQWNGSYRTTTLVDSTHVQVSIPATDLAAIGTASITAINPGALASSAINFSIQ